MKQQVSDLDQFFSVDLDLFCITDLQGRALRLNVSWERVLGYPPVDLTGRSLFDLVHPEDIQTTRHAFSNLSSQKRISRFVNRYQHRNGAYCFLEWTAYSDGNLVYAVARDITESKASENELKMFKRLFDSANFGASIVDIEGNFQYVNEYFAQVHGYSVAELSGKNLVVFHTPDQVEDVRKDISRLIATGGNQAFEVWHAHRDGSRFPMLMSGFVLDDDQGKPRLLAATALDISHRKTMEEALRRNEERFLLIAQSSTELILQTDLTGTIRYCSPAAQSIFGYLPEEMVDTHYSAYVSPAEIARVEEMFQQLISGETIHNMVMPITRKNGEPGFVEVSATPVVHKGQIIGLQSLIRDVTEKIAIQETMLDSQERFLLAVNGSRDGIWDWDLRNQRVYYSPTWKQMIGYQDSEFPNTLQAFEEAVHSEDKQRVREHLDQYLKGTIRDFSVEFRLHHKDGSYRWVLSRGEALRTDQGMPYRMAGSHTDITERKALELKLRSKEKMLSAIAQATDRFLEKGKYLEALQASLSLIAQAADFDLAYLFQCVQAPEKTHVVMVTQGGWHSETRETELFPHTTDQIPIEDLKSVLATLSSQQPFVGNIRDLPDSPLKKELNRLTLKSVVILPVFVRNTLWGFLCFGVGTREITISEGELSLFLFYAGTLAKAIERQTIEQELAEASEAAQMASRVKTEFLANMSHEIRTPLNGIIGFGDLLLETKLDEAQKQYMEHIKTSTRILMELINDILDYSRIEAGKLELDVVRTDLYDLMENAIEVIRYVAQKKGLELILTVNPQVPRLVQTDSLRLKQILINLLGNAVKFTHAGEVVLSVSVKKPAPIGDPVPVTFSVRDTGIGISPENRQKLFRAFSQADASNTRIYGGTGLGLVISSKILEKMESCLNLESTVGEGSTFYFTLPLVPGSGSFLAETDLKSIRRVLVVDDNETARTALSDVLESLGVEVVLARNGPEALSLIERSSEFDLVFIDYSMPVMNGLSLIKIIREKMMIPIEKLPIVLMVGTPEEKQICTDCSEYGVRSCLAKPILLSELFRVLDQIEAGEPDLPHPPVLTVPEPEDPSQNDQDWMVLVAEDNPINMMLVKKLIHKVYPCALVLEAIDGDMAVNTFLHYRPDLVLLDIQMPGRDGYAVASTIRQLEEPHQKRTPIVALSARALKGERQRCLEAGMDDFLSKPLDLKSFRMVLWKYLVPCLPQEGDRLLLSPGRLQRTPYKTSGLIKRLGGDLKLFRELVNHSRSTLRSMLDRLTEGIRAENLEAINQTLEHLQEHATNMEYPFLVELSSQVDGHRNSDPRHITRLIQRIQAECEALITDLTEQKPD